MKKFNFGKIFLLGFGFFGVSVIWSIYNAFVPLFVSGWTFRAFGGLDRFLHDAR